MNYSFIIRKATPEDAPAIESIQQESFKKYMEDTGLSGTMDALEESWEDITVAINNSEVYVAFIDDIAVGTIRVNINNDLTAYISRFGVRLQYHNIGIGKALLNLVEKMLRAQEVSSVNLHTASKYTDLVKFYYGRGFYVKSISEDRGYLRACMQKDF